MSYWTDFAIRSFAKASPEWRDLISRVPIQICFHSIFRKLKIHRARNAVSNPERTTGEAGTWCSGSAGVPYCDVIWWLTANTLIYSVRTLFSMTRPHSTLRTFIRIQFGREGKWESSGGGFKICKLWKGRGLGLAPTGPALSAPIAMNLELYFEGKSKIIIISKWSDCLAAFIALKIWGAWQKFSNKEEERKQAKLCAARGCRGPRRVGLSNRQKGLMACELGARSNYDILSVGYYSASTFNGGLLSMKNEYICI